jgi:hypothetical protein
LWLLPAAKSANLDQQFVDFLNGKASVRYFKVGLLGNLFIVNDKPIEGWVYYEGGIQDDTFWIRNCADSPTNSGQILPGWITGMSHKEYWVYRDEAVGLSIRNSKTPSPLDTRAEAALMFVRKALGIGAAIEPGSFQVDSNNDFVARIKDEKIKGHFEVAANGFPTRCEYFGESPYLLKLNAKVSVRYVYAANSDFFTTLTATIHKGPVEVEKTEYRVIACEFGTSALPAEGYSVDYMTNFGGVNLRVRDLVGVTVITNGVMYKKAPNGKMTVINNDVKVMQVQTRRRHGVILIVMSITMILPIWLVARSRWQLRNREQKP